MARRSRRSGGRDPDRYPEDAPTDLDRFHESMVDPVSYPSEVSWLGSSPASVVSQVARARSGSPLFIPAKPQLVFPVSSVFSRRSVCLQRSIRSEVLHALGIAGQRGIGAGGVRRTANSKRRC